jgi:hypothetical protein
MNSKAALDVLRLSVEIYNDRAFEGGGEHNDEFPDCVTVVLWPNASEERQAEVRKLFREAAEGYERIKYEGRWFGGDRRLQMIKEARAFVEEIGKKIIELPKEN